MKYYKVKENNQYWDRKTGIHIGYVVKDELFTEREMKKSGYPFTKNFEPVEIKKTDTYWFFGCRFQCHES